MRAVVEKRLNGPKGFGFGACRCFPISFRLHKGTTKDWSPLAIDEQVMVFNLYGDVVLAFLLGGLFHGALPPNNSPNEHEDVPG